MINPLPEWLELRPGAAPLLVSLPHTGTDLPAELLPRLTSPWLARKDTDWYVDRLYEFASELGATVLRTKTSRTVIDVNRDPTGRSLYPGRTTTELCPVNTFDGEALHRPGGEPGPEEILTRRTIWFDPYHAVLAAEISRLRAIHGCVVVYDCHSIRSIVPRLFDGVLPHFNLGTNGGRTCDPRLITAVELAITPSGFTQITNGRFRGGYITRHHGRPAEDVHALQMELAIRGYLQEPAEQPGANNWPPPYEETLAAPLQAVLRRVLESCLAFARAMPGPAVPPVIHGGSRP